MPGLQSRSLTGISRIDRALALIRQSGPRVMQNADFRLMLPEAEVVCQQLRKDGLSIYPSDIPRTKGVWEATEPLSGLSYKLIAIDQLVRAVAKRLEVDPHKTAGFKLVAANINTDTFYTQPINEHGTTIRTVLKRYQGSHARALLGLVNQHPDYGEVKQSSVSTADIGRGSFHTWRSKDGKFTELSLSSMKKLLEILATDPLVDYRTLPGFKAILPQIERESFAREVINEEWATKFPRKALARYRELILHLIEHDPDFAEIKQAPDPLRLYDFPITPHHYWEKLAPAEAAQAVGKLVEAVALQLTVPPYTLAGFLKVYNVLTPRRFSITSINCWDTTLDSLLKTRYNENVDKALAELVTHNPRFAKAAILLTRSGCFANQLIDVDGKPTDLARDLLRDGVQALALRHDVAYRSLAGLTKILPTLQGGPDFLELPVNKLGITVSEVLELGYNGKRTRALIDLFDHHLDFRAIKDVITKALLAI